MMAWLRFLRVVNLPTVPGDVLVGAASVLAACSAPIPPVPLAGACMAGVCLYLFGLADNDLVGRATDRDRPLPSGEISVWAAVLTRGLLLFAVPVVGAAVNLPPAWWIASFLLSAAIVLYNRTKGCLLMGLCRGLNVVCGGCAVWPVLAGTPATRTALVCLSACAGVWTAYVAGVTRYSEGEEADPERKRRVGLLVGGIVYLQLLALLFFMVRPLLVAGGVLLVLLRLMRRMLPKVSAS